MFPVICKIGPLTIYSYGTMLALAVLICTSMLIRDAKKAGVSPDFVVDFIFWTVLIGIMGARLFYIIINLPYFIENPAEIIMLQKGGLAFQGGLIAGTLTGIVYCRKKGIPVLKFADLAIPYMALGQGIGRIGCFLNGCCFGKKVIWGVYHPVDHEMYHPTQLYMFAGLLIIFCILKRIQKRSQYAGEVFLSYFIFVPVLRFFIEFLRADHYHTLFGLSVYQHVCIVLLTVTLYARTRIKSRISR